MVVSLSLLLTQEALEEQNKARIEQAKKMDTLIKRMDHTERARRENEAPLLQEAYAQKIKASLAYNFCFPVFLDQEVLAFQKKCCLVTHAVGW